jgi:hypothetical protein
MDTPYRFHVDLDPDLFTLDRLDALYRKASPKHRTAWYSDVGRERPPGRVPPAQLRRSTIAEDLAEQRIDLRITRLHEWDPDYEKAREQVLDAAGVNPRERQYVKSTTIRIFSPGAVVAFHGDGETQFNVGVGGRNVWHLYPPDSLSPIESEALLRGGRFPPWRETTPFATYDLGIGDAFAAPSRWPHWIEHPGPEPAVSFGVAFWTAADLRNRKVLDVNWLLRRAKLSPRPPGESERRDRMKRTVFDAISLATGKGAEYRGV